MTTYNTGNPIGSTEAKDLYDNAENLDIAINSPSADVWTDRLGQARKTWRGIQNEAQLEIAQVVGEVTAQSQQYLDASIVARDEARAAASASGPIAFYGTYAAAQAAVGGLPDGGIVEISQDETRVGARTRYKVQAGALVFVVNFDQVRLDLANTTDIEKGAALVAFVPSGTGATPTTVEAQLKKSQTTDVSLEVAYAINTATEKPRNVVAVDGFLHVINQATTGSTLQPTYQIFDIASDGVPVLISTTNVGAVGDDYRALVIRGDRAFIGSMAGRSIKTYDISNKKAPLLLSTVQIPSGGTHALNLAGNVLFVTAYQAGAVHAYDVSTDTPVIIGSIGLGAVSVMGSYICGDYLYCCTNTAAVSFFAVNIKNPYAMNAVEIVLPADAVDGRNVYVNGRYAYVACIASDTVEIIDVANPAVPVWEARISVPGPKGNTHWVRGLGKYLVVGAGETALYDASNPVAPVHMRSIAATGTSLDLYGNRIFIGDYSANQIKVVRSPFPSTVMQEGGSMVLDALFAKEANARHIRAESVDAENAGVRVLRTREYSASAQSGARVFATANQTISGGAFTIVQFPNVEFDTQGEWSVADNAFVAKSDGTYLVTANLLTDSAYAAGNYGQVDVLLNGVVHSLIGSVPPLTAATNRHVNGVAIVRIAKGQNIQLRWYSSEATTFLASSANTWMSIQKLA